MADEAQFDPPASQVDLERRQESGNASDRVLSTSDEYARREAARADDDDSNQIQRSFAVEDNDLSNYVGTDPIYQNYANDTEAPLKAEEGPESVLEEVVEEERETQKEYVTNIPGVDTSASSEPADEGTSAETTGTTEAGADASQQQAEGTSTTSPQVSRRASSSSSE